jgi:precorrin-2 dehydrogenase/sirohydrochlorin ferrochelatase
MLPITVDVARVRVVLIGNGDAARRRLALLDRAGARRLEVYGSAPSAELAAAAGGRLRRRLPRVEEILCAQLVFLAGVGGQVAARLRQIADSAGVLLNVEDDIARSDFHSPAVVRRGDLTVAISTGGKNPGLAAAIRKQVDVCFGPEWAARLDRAAALRSRWRNAGCDTARVARLTMLWLERQGGIAPQADSLRAQPAEAVDSLAGAQNADFSSGERETERRKWSREGPPPQSL